jgi:hypothetical protein
MGDEMFFSPDAKSLRRGRREARRTPTCRPCLVWLSDVPGTRLQGVVLDVSAVGLLIRMMEPVPQGAALHIQFMRDENYSEPLASPIEGYVVRQTEATGAFFDHGIRITRGQGAKPVERPAPSVEPKSQPLRSASRMHTFDFTVGERGTRRTGR